MIFYAFFTIPFDFRPIHKDLAIIYIYYKIEFMVCEFFIILFSDPNQP